MTKTTNRTIYWSNLAWKGHTLLLAATDQGLCYVGSPDAPFSEIETWVQQHMPDATLVKDDKKLTDAAKAIRQFLDEETKDIDTPLDVIGTSFQRTVWQCMRDVPYGKTATYSDIAQKIGKPKAARAVGAAIGANPLMIVLPCHRIIAKNGSLTGFRGGLAMKEELLNIEKNRA